MQLSTKGRYAVMAMVVLAQRGGSAALPITEIAEGQNLPVSYLEQLFMKLRRAGLVTAARGPRGGYRLARPASDINLAEIMMAADETMRMTRCGHEGVEACLGTKRCVTHDLWSALGLHIESFLKAVSLQHVLDGAFPLAAAPAAAAVAEQDERRTVAS